MVARMSPLFELSETALGFVVSHWFGHGFLLWVAGHRAKRHQTRYCLLDLVATRLHDGSALGRISIQCRDLPPDDARVFQGIAVPGGWLGHHRDCIMSRTFARWVACASTCRLPTGRRLIGSLALIGFPGFSGGFFSKDLLIEAVHESHWHTTEPVRMYWIAYLSVLLGVFVTALYTFRMFFLVFHGEDTHGCQDEIAYCMRVTVGRDGAVDSCWQFPSAVIGWYTVEPVLFGSYFGERHRLSLQRHDVLARLGAEWHHGRLGLVTHAMQTPIFWLAAAGVLTAWFLYLKRPDIPATIKDKVSGLYNLLDRKYYMDDLYIKGFAAGGRRSIRQLPLEEGRRTDH